MKLDELIEINRQLSDNNKKVAEIIKDCKRKDVTIFWMRVIILMQLAIILFLSIKPIHF